VHRVERPHGLDRERLLGAGCDLGGDLEYGPPGRGLCQRRTNLRGVGFGEVLENDRSPDRPMAFDEREPRADDLGRRAKDLEDLLSPRLVEEPPQDGARLRVDRQDSARSASSSAWLGRRKVARLLRYARGS
jgi:hypothetical protein